MDYLQKAVRVVQVRPTREHDAQITAAVEAGGRILGSGHECLRGVLGIRDSD
jgi:hypothetical protein